MTHMNLSEVFRDSPSNTRIHTMTFHRHQLSIETEPGSCCSSAMTSRAATRTHSTSSIPTLLSSSPITPSSTGSLTPELTPRDIQLELGELNCRLNTLDLMDNKENTIVNCDDDELFSSVEPENFSSPKTVKWVVILVGLPASGKSTITRHLMLYLAALNNYHLSSKVFNAGDIRRRSMKDLAKSADLFDFNNKSSAEMRENFAKIALDNLLRDLVETDLNVGIFDATNSTKTRRAYIKKMVDEKAAESGQNIKAMILEVKCPDLAIRRYNIECKASNQDYAGMPRDQAILDFILRTEKYEAAFEPITEKELVKLGTGYVSICNVGESVMYDIDCFNDDDLQSQGRDYLKDRVFKHIYTFVRKYRNEFATKYLHAIERFYFEGGYKKVKPTKRLQ